MCGRLEASRSDKMLLGTAFFSIDWIRRHLLASGTSLLCNDIFHRLLSLEVSLILHNLPQLQDLKYDCLQVISIMQYTCSACSWTEKSHSIKTAVLRILPLRDLNGLFFLDMRNLVWMSWEHFFSIYYHATRLHTTSWLLMSLYTSWYLCGFFSMTWCILSGCFSKSLKQILGLLQ